MILHFGRDGHSLLVAAGLAAGIALVCAACRPDQPNGQDAALLSAGRVASAADGFATGISSSDSRFVINITGFVNPESAHYDPGTDAFFVSNMVGYGSLKDGNGYISRVDAGNPNRSIILVQGGRNGAVLNAPKGITISGDTLWVTDIDVLRAFDRRSGAPLATVDFAPLHAVQLNDVAVAPDGSLRVTDTGILMNEAGAVHTGPDRIFAVKDGVISVVAEGPQLRQPNGITWDPVGKRWIVVSYDPFVGEVATFTDGHSVRHVIRTGSGKLDGVEVVQSGPMRGAILFSSWADSSVHILENGRERKLIRQLPVPADIGLDTKRNRIAVPLSGVSWVQLWSLGPEGAALH